MSLRRSTLSPRAGWASKERCPSARGPYSARPWNQATIPFSAMILAAAAAMSGGRSKGTRAVLRASSICWSLQPRPRAAVVIGASSSPASAATVSAAPRAVPESPAAGCTQISANGPSSSNRVLATQFKATPPARASRLRCGRATSRRDSAPPQGPPARWPQDRRGARRTPHPVGVAVRSCSS